MNKKGQSMIEYIMLLTIIIGVIVAMGNYIKRGFSGKWKAALDGMGDQYDPRVAISNIQHDLQSTTNTDIVIVQDAASGGYYTSRRDTSRMVETKTGSITISSY